MVKWQDMIVYVRSISSMGGKQLIKILIQLYNIILKTKSIPASWKTSNIILLYKKGCKYNTKNYRLISLMPVLAKIFSSMLDFHMREALELQQISCQTGFKKGFSTVDHLHTVNILIQKATEHRIPCHLAFIDFTKAFDLLNQNFMLQTLINHGLNFDFVELIQEMYTGLKAKIITDVKGNSLNINRGVR